MLRGFDSRDVIGLLMALYEEQRAMSWATRLSLFNGGSTRGEEEYGIFGGFPGMREWIGERQMQTAIKKTYNIRNVKYESSMPFAEEDADRDKSGLFEAYIRDYAAQSPVGHWEDLIIALLNANGTCYDGIAYFSASHVLEAETAQVNELTATQCPALNIGTATAPTAEEAARALLQVIGYMRTFRNNKGRLVNRNAKQFTVMTASTAIGAAIQEAVSSNTLSGTVSNPLNGERLVGLKIEVEIEPDYTGSAPTTEFLTFRTDGNLKPFLLQEEKALTYDMLDRTSDYFKLQNKLAVLLDARRGAGYGLWQHASRSTLS